MARSAVVLGATSGSHRRRLDQPLEELFAAAEHDAQRWRGEFK